MNFFSKPTIPQSKCTFNIQIRMGPVCHNITPPNSTRVTLSMHYQVHEPILTRSIIWAVTPCGLLGKFRCVGATRRPKLFSTKQSCDLTINYGILSTDIKLRPFQVCPNTKPFTNTKALILWAKNNTSFTYHCLLSVALAKTKL